MSVRQWRDTHAPDLRLIEAHGSTATVADAAVCPFGLAIPLPVYTDVSLGAFETVFPAAGSRNASLEIAPERLAELTNATWVDCCTLPA